MAFFLETLLGGLMAGMLYSLVALGFVLIYKASGVFNFAQGAMVLFAALAMARFARNGSRSGLGLERQAARPTWWPFAMARSSCMFLLAWLIERLVLRHLVNQEGVTLVDGHAGHHLLPGWLGPDGLRQRASTRSTSACPRTRCSCSKGTFEGGVLVNLEDVYGRDHCGVLWWRVLSVFFQKTSTGRALRAVADDHQAAQSIGIPLNRIWVIVWCVAGFVTALVAGIIWGSASSACSSR